MTFRVRYNSNPGASYPTGKYRFTSGSNPNSGGTWFNDISPPRGSSSSSKCTDNTNPGPPFRSGGFFYVVKDEQIRTVLNVRGWTGSQVYVGPMWLSTVPSAASVAIADPTTELFGLGSTGMARAKPGQPEFPGLNFLAELRELPRVKRDRPSNLGNEFGLGQTMRDLRRLYNIQIKLSERINQLRRDNGQKVRRRVDLYSTNDTNTLDQGQVTGVVPSKLIKGLYGRGSVTTSKTARSWYVGAFRYYIPDIGTNQWSVEVVRHLLGGDVNPEVVWNAMPWTWLNDWFNNVADILSNVSANAAEDLVQVYGYVMGTKTSSVMNHVTVPIYNWDKSTTQQTFISGRKTTVKMRVAGFPYSFGATPGSLSNRQVGILGALGLSKTGLRI